MTERAKQSEVQWFVECGNPFSNESVTCMLAEIGIGDAESKYPSMLGSDGKPHDVILIPSDFVKKIRAAKQGDSRFKYRFFKRNGKNGVISPADFLERRRPSKAQKEARENLARIWFRKRS